MGNYQNYILKKINLNKELTKINNSRNFLLKLCDNELTQLNK